MKKLPFHQRSAHPNQCYAQHNRATGIERQCEIVSILQQQIDIVGKRREGGEASAEARDEQGAHGRRDGLSAFGGAKE